MTKVALTSLGCARNLVDSELILGSLRRQNMRICEDIDGVDVVIINTCGFIKEAIDESVDAIRQFCDLKKEGRLKKVIAAGCLVQRYGKELSRHLPDVDGFVGVNELPRINQIVKDVLAGKRVIEVSGEPFIDDGNTPRVLLTPRHFRYVKICEGCNHGCTFCAIPGIKGSLRSRSRDSVVAEVRKMVEEGAREIVIIGQDTSQFGHDRGEADSLPKLLKQICSIEGDFWVRLLYGCPTHFSDELIAALSTEKKICRYVDLPVQHIDGKILKAMARPEIPEEIVGLIGRIREAIPEVTIRTSLIVGFPGEGEKEFQQLLHFVRKTKFERLGAFEFSAEEGTSAAAMPGQVPEEVKHERFDRLMRLQQQISAENNKKLLGETQKIIIDGWSEQPDYRCVGRTEGDAPELDGCVYVQGGKARPGEFTIVEFTGCLEYDLIGREVHEPSE